MMACLEEFDIVRVFSIPLVGFSVGRWETAGQSDHHLRREHTVDESQEELIHSVVHVRIEFVHLIEAGYSVVLGRLAEIDAQTLRVGPNNLLVLFRACILECHILAHINLRSIHGVTNLDVRKNVS